MTLFEDLPIHPLRTKYETEHNAQSCIIGYSDVDMCDVFSMDSAGYVYGTHLYGNFVLYGKSGHHFIENYLRYGSADFFWRTIAPYNEFRLIEIFSRNPTIASVISYKQTLFGPGLPSRSNTRYEIDQRLREAGFTVHTVNAEPEHAASTLGFPIYSRLDFVPKPVHLIMYNSSSIASDIIAAALKLGIPTIIPTFSGHDLNAIGQCELLGLEFIECSIEHALQRLNTITGQCATYGH
jgi:hypothetical protein